ncbi:hypothetical protein [Streptomyces lasiicapitis]|uniref:hypothetical protein n=1 Tax=Streptomyces lasiicapitis TaxID=1923961 RepID=UPI0036B25E30
MAAKPVRAAGGGASPPPPCLACGLTDGSVPLPGGAVLRTAHWAVEHCVGPLGVGTFVVKPLRHVTGVHELSAEEAGPTRTRWSRSVGGCGGSWVEGDSEVTPGRWWLRGGSGRHGP